MRARGFTLVELVMVIVITGILAATLTIFLKPAIDSYVDTRRRAEMSDVADTALRRMAQDIRSAVPNSVRVHDDQCFELLPTSAGGRYRMAPDITPAGVSVPSKPIDTSEATSEFDVLSPIPPFANVKAGDWVVIDNQNGGEAYTSPEPGPRALITGFSSATSAEQKAIYQHRIKVQSMPLLQPKQFPVGYDGGRFVVVPNNGGRPAVVYVCDGADDKLDAQGNGKGTLYRLTRGFTATLSACPATAGGAILATHVRTCTFFYDPNNGATQQSGFVWMRLELSQANESVTLAYGVHVDNVP